MIVLPPLSSPNFSGRASTVESAFDDVGEGTVGAELHRRIRHGQGLASVRTSTRALTYWPGQSVLCALGKVALSLIVPVA